MSRRKKLIAKYTPLSLIDKTIYGVSMILIITFFILAFIWFVQDIPRLFAKNQGDIIANDNTAILPLLTMLLVMYVISIMIYFWIKLYNKKQPFFGNKKYKQRVPTIKTYPLFSKEFKNRPKESRKKHTPLIILICILVLIVLSLLYLLGLFNRQVITEDYIIQNYDSFNQLTDERKIKDADKMQIYIDRASSGKGGYYYLRISFTYGDETFGCSLSSFYGNDKEKLNHIIALKEIFQKEKIEIDTKNYQKAIDEYDFNEEELIIFKQVLN